VFSQPAAGRAVQPGASRVPLSALLVASALSATGTAITLVVVPWFVLQTTGSALRAGVVAACELVPLTVSSLVAGPAVERLGRRRTAILSDLCSVAAFGAIPLMHGTVGLTFWQLCALVAAGGLARAPGATARKVLLPAMAQRSGTPLERATSAFSGASQAGRLLGAPAGGVLIVAVGPAGGLLVTAAGFALSAIIVATLVPAGGSAGGAVPAGGSAGINVPAAGSAHAAEPAGSAATNVPAAGLSGRDTGYLRELRDGLVYVARDRLVLAMVSMAVITNMLDRTFSAVLLPVYARDVLGSAIGLGTIFGALGIGALVGTVVFGAIGHRIRLRPAFGLAFLLMGAPRFGLLAATDDLQVVLVGVFLCGIAAGAVDPIVATALLRRIPDALQARVFGVLTSAVLAAMPVGALLGGLLVETVGLRTALIAGGTCYLLVSLSPFVFSTWRALDERRCGSLAG
jgi:MFS family permease